MMREDWNSRLYDFGHPYAWRTKLRGFLPWFLIDMNFADKGKDCASVGAWHRWYNSDERYSRCYHCKAENLKS